MDLVALDIYRLIIMGVTEGKLGSFSGIFKIVS